MATERRLLEYQDGELLDAENPALSDEETAFQNFRESLKAGEEMATLRVSRIPKSGITGHPANAKTVYCFSCPIDRYEFEDLLDYIVENYGGGLYRLIGTKKGKVGTAFNRLVEIAEPIKPKDSSNNPGGFGAIMESVAGMLNASQERTEQMIARLQPPPLAPVPQADPFALMERMATLFATLGVLGNKGGGSDFTGELDKMVKLKALVQDFAGDGGSDDDDRGPRRGSNAYDLIGKTLDTFAPVIVQGMSQAKTASMKTLPIPTAAVSPAPVQGQNSMHALKPQIETLVRNAQKGIPPENMAHNVIAMTPQERLADLQNFVGAADAVSRMAAIVPMVNSHRPWFDSLRAHILNELQGEAAEPTDTQDLQGDNDTATFDDTAPDDSAT